MLWQSTFYSLYVDFIKTSGMSNSLVATEVYILKINLFLPLNLLRERSFSKENRNVLLSSMSSTLCQENCCALSSCRRI